MFISLTDLPKERSKTDEHGITFITGDQHEEFVSYREMFDQAGVRLGALQEKGWRVGDEVIFQIEDNREFLITFWACLLGRMIPVPVTVGNNEEHRLKLWKIWETLKNPSLVTSSGVFSGLRKAKDDSRLEKLIPEVECRTVFIEDFAGAGGLGEIIPAGPEDIAFIQFSSGSTGAPKGVVLTHQNLLANLYAILEAGGLKREDRLLSWMPLTHDMGLIGFHLASVILECEQFLMPTSLFIKQPTLWLKKASQYQATILGSPNFGLKHFLNFYRPEAAAAWDLSSVRLIFNGAEPISSGLCQAFLEAMARRQLKRNTMFPVYGLAEASLGVCFPAPGGEMVTHHLDRRFLKTGERIKKTDPQDENTVTFVEVGYPLRDCQVRIRDENNQVLEEEQIGSIQIRGRNVTGGYYRNPEANEKTFTSDGWLDTGDLGFLQSGSLVVTGRAKEIIFVNGQNVYPHDLERVAAEVEEFDLGKVAACGVFNEQLAREEIILFVVFKKSLAEFVPQARKLRIHLMTRGGWEIGNVLPVMKIPKTTSGKIQRYKLGEGYLNGEFSEVAGAIAEIFRKEAEDKVKEYGRDEIEAQLLRICQEITQNPEIGRHDNYYEAGANSLQLIQIAARIEADFGKRIGVADLFAYPSVAQLAQYMEIGAAGERVQTPRHTGTTEKDIAVIGIALKLPMADNLDDFWNIIRHGLDCVSELPAKRRQDLEEYFIYLRKNLEDVKYFQGAYLEAIDQFDYSFFKISPKEAQLMNPVQRMFLEVVWKTIEDAGYAGHQLEGSNTGIFVGYIGDLEGYKYKEKIHQIEPALLPLSFAGNLPALMPGRISYLLNLKGPSLLMDTACSSSLVAVHYACQSIRSGECDQAIAGGAKIHLAPLDADNYKIGIESSDYLTRTFDEQADGSGIGEGIISIFLKPYHRALQDHDHIYAVIKGSAVNQDGKSAVLTAPNPEAQTEVVLRAYQNAGVNPESITYLEAHGTGTKVGDPIEFDGLLKAFTRFTRKKQFCAIGSVKANYGHLYDCSGLLALVKAVLALKNKELPPAIHFNVPNGQINFEDSPFYVNVRRKSWDSDQLPRRCGVSSFGISGTNCHLVLEEAPVVKSVKIASGPQIFTLSAKKEAALKEMVLAWQAFLAKDFPQKIRLDDLCFTLNTGRSHYHYRLAVIAENIPDLKEKIDQIARQGIDRLSAGWFYYSGQPASGAGMKLKEEGEGAGDQNMELNEEAARIVTALISTTAPAKRDLLKSLGRLYIAGADPEWQTLYRDRNVYRISLPGYAFQKDRCWIEIGEAGQEPERYDYYYGLNWRVAEPEESTPEHEEGAVIVFRNDSPWENSLVQRLQETTGELIEVYPGSRFQKVKAGLYTVQNQIDDYRALFQDLASQKIFRVIHLLTLENKRTASLEELEISLERGAHSLFYLSKSLVPQQREVHLVLISKLANRVTGEEEDIYPENAAFLGLGKVISREMPHFRLNLLDLDDVTGVEETFQEIKNNRSPVQVAYRKNRRYLAELRRLDLGQLPDREVRIRENGVYLITGGTGGLGLEMAKYLSSQNKVRLNLIGRSRFPEAGEWERLLDEKRDQKAIRVIQTIREIEESGSKVELYQADVSDEQSIEEVLGKIRKENGAINGIFHAAGVVNNKLIMEESLDDLKAVLKPKIHGTRILDRLTAADHLDYFVVFSSVASLFFAPAQGDYVAANSYLDSYAAGERRTDRPMIAINWSTWRETGMAAERGFTVDTIFKTLRTAEAVACFAEVTSKRLSNVLIGRFNYQSKFPHSPKSFFFELSPEIRAAFSSGRLGNHQFSSPTRKRTSARVTLSGRKDSPYTETENKIAQIWSETLGFAEINIYENFFELGGDSILGLKIVNQINQEFHKQINVVDLFKNLTVHALSQYLDQAFEPDSGQGLLHNPIRRVEVREDYLLSSAQKRLYILHQLDQDNTNYNISRALLLEGQLNTKLLEESIGKIIKRHEIIRTSFITVNGELRQKVQRDLDLQITYLKMEEKDLERTMKGLIAPFDLSKPPLIRVWLIAIAPAKWILFFDMHHLITDGFSMDRLIFELSSFYNGQELPALKIQYKDYAEWELSFMATDLVKKQEEYWLNLLTGPLPVLNLPTDFPRPAFRDYQGNTINFQVEPALLNRLSDLAKNTQTTMFTVLLAVYHILLAKYSAQEDILIGAPVSGRPHQDLEELVGMLVNTIVIRNYPRPELRFRDFLERVKEQVMQAFANQDYQFEVLISKLGLKRDLSRNPLFDVLFSFRSVGTKDLLLENLRCGLYPVKNSVALFDLIFEVIEKNHELDLSIIYATDLYKRESIARMIENLKVIIDVITRDFNIKLGEIALDNLPDFTPIQNESSFDKVTFDL